MTLHPLRGIDNLEFGSPLPAIISRLGVPTEMRAVKAPWLAKIFYYDQHDLTLGVDFEDQLAWLSVGSASDAELWGDHPFQLLSEAELDFAAPLMRWLASKAKKPATDRTCFGATVSIPADGVVFCLASTGETIIEGIQLENLPHLTNARAQL